MNNQPLPLEFQFQVQRLKLYLEQNPEKGIELAIAHFEDYLDLANYCNKLEEQKKSPSLPPILPPKQEKLKAEYDDLRKRYIKALTDNHHLRHQVQELIELACALSDDDAPTPSFLKEAFDE